MSTFEWTVVSYFLLIFLGIMVHILDRYWAKIIASPDWLTIKIRERHWNPVLTFWGAVVGVVALGFAIAYGMVDKHPVPVSLFFFAALVLILGGLWSRGWTNWLKMSYSVLICAAFISGDVRWIRSFKQSPPPPIPSANVTAAPAMSVSEKHIIQDLPKLTAAASTRKIGARAPNKSTPPVLIQQIAPPTSVDQTRSESITLIRKMDESWSDFLRTWNFALGNPAEGFKEEPYREDKAVNDLGNKYRNDFQKKAQDLQDRLLGNIHGSPPQTFTDRDSLYNPLIFPNGRMNPSDFRDQLLDLKQLLNTMERENGMSISCQDVNPQRTRIR